MGTEGKQYKLISRRDFLKIAGLGLAGLAIASVPQAIAESTEQETEPDKDIRLLVEASNLLVQPGSRLTNPDLSTEAITRNYLNREQLNIVPRMDIGAKLGDRLVELTVPKSPWETSVSVKVDVDGNIFSRFIHVKLPQSEVELIKSATGYYNLPEGLNINWQTQSYGRPGDCYYIGSGIFDGKKYQINIGSDGDSNFSITDLNRAL